MQKILLNVLLIIAAVSLQCVYAVDVVAEADSAKKASEKSGPADPAAVVLTVNGIDITEGQVEEAIKQQLASRSKSSQSESMLERYRSIMRPKVLDSLINVELISQAAAKEGLALTEEDIQSRLKEIVDIAMSQSGMTREELAKDILKRQGMTIEESLAKYRKNKQFLDTILLEKVAAAKYPQEIDVSDEEIQKYYDENKETRYTKQEMVRASHILIKTLDKDNQPMDDEGKAAAMKQIKEIQSKLTAEDSDFAELAKEFSQCPSGKRSGGDLNFFARKGAMVEPFAAAAFELKPGQVSDVVETRFGYHLIKCTDRKPGKITKLSEVKSDIASLLARSKKSGVLSKLTSTLRQEAEIVYTNPDDDPAVKAKKAAERKAQAQAAAEAKAATQETVEE